jgi:hypothetical protein
VEGFEPSVLASAKGLLLGREVRHVIMEYSPGVAEKNGDWASAEENVAKALGCACGCMGTRAHKHGFVTRRPWIACRQMLWIGTTPMLLKFDLVSSIWLPRRLLHAGYSILQIDEWMRAASVKHRWDAQLPAMPAVTQATLLQDLHDVHAMRRGQLGCPLPPEARNKTLTLTLALALALPSLKTALSCLLG